MTLHKTNSIKLGILSCVALPMMVGEVAFAQDTVELEEIIVTAQKRAENLQDVPISVSTLNSEDARVIFSGIDDVLGLANRIPGLYVESSNGRIAPRFYIRGLGNTDFDTAASQPVSIIMDDVVHESVILKSFPIFDVAQIETLRGPQGTLFGRNTPAGIVKIDTRKPTEFLEGHASLNYGSFNTINSQFAVGGPLVEGVLSSRFSGFLQRQSDFIDNGFTGEEDFAGGFRELAGRLQLHFTPSDRFSALFSVQKADLNGTASIFRANIIGPGNNNLNDNYDRNEVFYDGGGGNPGNRDILALSLKMEYDISDTVSFTSITAYSDLDRFGRGDIDGGFVDFATGQTGPGFIPFPSDTGGTSTSDQFTQEVRLASTDDSAFKWQIGAFYFDSSLTDTTDAQLGFIGVSPSTNVTDNEAWATFGQIAYDLTDRVTITGGIRYSDDQKSLEVTELPVPGFTLGNGTTFTSVEDSEVSWDISLSYAANDDVSLYSRVARGFRGPSIQGRNVAFVGDTSIAQSETIQSYEVGLKSTLLENRLRFNAAAFYYEVSDIQITAVGGGGNFIGLLNADSGEAYGFEADLEFAATENLSIRAGFGYADTAIRQDGLTVPVCGSGVCTVLDQLDANGNALIDGNPLPQAPKYTFNFSARYTIPLDNGDELYFDTDWAVQGETNFFLYEAAEYRTNGNFEGGARIGYVFDEGAYEVAVFGRNITNESNLIGGIDFNNNTGFVNNPRVIGVALSANF